jgi:hypothetical protein
MSLTIAFTGLPSAGKSTAINAIAGRRVLQSGVARTSLQAHFVGRTNHLGAPSFTQADVRSDDDVECNLLDLPGVADGQNASEALNFDALTLEWVVKADIVLWLSDSRTAFITSHELAEFNKVRAALANDRRTRGALRQLAVLLTKCEHVPSSAGSGVVGRTDGNGEIVGAEDTTLDHSLDRVKKLVGDDPVFQFNAFARVATAKKGQISDALSTFIRGLGGFGPNNTRHSHFNLRWAADGLPAKRGSAAVTCLLAHHYPATFADEAGARACVAQFAELDSKHGMWGIVRLLQCTDQPSIDKVIAEHHLPAVTFDVQKLNALAGIVGREPTAEVCLLHADSSLAVGKSSWDAAPATHNIVYRMYCLYGDRLPVLRKWIDATIGGDEGVKTRTGTFTIGQPHTYEGANRIPLFSIALRCCKDETAGYDNDAIAEVARVRKQLWGDEKRLCVAALVAAVCSDIAIRQVSTLRIHTSRRHVLARIEFS